MSLQRKIKRTIARNRKRATRFFKKPKGKNKLRTQRARQKATLAEKVVKFHLG